MYEIVHDAGLDDPVLVVAFEGWVSAGSAGTATAEHLAYGGSRVAEFDADALYDFRANRPTVEFAEGVLDEIVWPALTIDAVHHGDRDMLVLSGTEPNWHWMELSESVAELSRQLGVVEQISLGGIPWATPHTRPTPVVTTASSSDRLPAGEEHPDGLLRVPGAAVSIVEAAVNRAGIPSVGFWARVPHYVGSTYVPAVVALVERIAHHLSEPIALGDLLDQAADQRARLDAAVAGRGEAEAMIEQLEQLVDAAASAPSGEELAAEIERFLIEQREDGGPLDGT